MIAVKFHKGQGLGNQLFTYVTTRSIAYDLGLNHTVFQAQNFGAPRWNKRGVYFLNISVEESHLSESQFDIYNEKEERLFLNGNFHDKNIGCDIRGFDVGLLNLKPFTIIEGNLQHEDYFKHNKLKILEWLNVKQEFESNEFNSDNLCVINFRGGEYVGQKELFLNKEYFQNAMKIMKELNSCMEFIVITDDVYSAQLYFNKIPCFHFDLAKDYVTIKNAKYLILSNSSFPFFAVYTNQVVEYIIAPKYWARHNVSTGYWASNQNIYSGWNYLDRKGEIFTAEQCRLESTIKKTNKF